MGPLTFTQIVPETKLRTTLALAHYTKPTIAKQRFESTIVLERKLLGNQVRRSILQPPLLFPYNILFNKYFYSSHLAKI